MATLGRNIVFPIKNADGTSFHDLVLRKATVDSVVMSLGDKITGDVYYNDNTLQCTMQEYVEYNNVKYTIVNPPTIVREGLVKDNSDLKGMTKYSFEFYHPMYILGNLPFSDVAVSNDEKKHLSQNKTFSWIGKPQDYINKINKNLEGTEWIVVKSERFPQEKDDELSDVLSFDNNTIADALKTGYETWGLPYVVSQINIGEPYYSQGKRFKVEFGLPSNEILVNNEPYIFQFGQGVGLKNNSRTPRNNKIITRIAGYGSENNIPYGYPQIRWYGDQSATQTPDGYPIYDGIVGGVVRKLIKHPFTRTHLMPSIYSQTVFNKVSPYIANGSDNPDYDPDTEIIDYYDAVYSEEYPYINEINLLAPSYEIHEFADVKPELDSDRQLGIVSAVPLNQDLTPASQWDDTYDAEKDEYVQSYFKITLPQLSFDLYACASIMEEMQVNMRGGACIGCTFPIQVDWEDYKKNFYDANGNFLPDGSQRDLTKYPKSNLGQIDIIVKKETQTFGTLMPNIYQQPKTDDLFVILGISMPLEYITDAEERLDDAMKSYMLENNVYYYDYPLKFDEYFLATHTNILSQIRPNSIIRFGFKGYPDPLELFVKQLTVKYGEGVLPQYDITLTDNIEVVLNQIGQVADDVEKLGSLVAILRQTYNRNIWSELDKKLSKVKDDSTPHKLGMGEMQVEGDGTIGGDLSVSGDATINGNTTIGSGVTDEVLVNAIMSVLSQMKSTNYTDDSPIGKGGWNLLSEDANGNSYFVVDKLFVRLKAIFNELEIRKISYAGGNIIFSHAGSEIVEVRWLDSNGDELEPIDANLSSVVKFRCYFTKDDGTTATENWWKVDDQAKCQTFNIEEGVHQNVENTYYWRKVVAVGSERVTISGTTSEEEYNYADLSLSDCDANSDIPKAGDSIVQMGNRTDTDRQGFVTIEVYGSDAPCLKIYNGVNNYNLSEDRARIVMSPKRQKIIANELTQKTSYGTFPTPRERGEWDDITNHRCYYFDRVQHDGSSWLCTYPEGSTPEYTTEEPSLTATYWRLDAKAGEPAPSYTQEWYAWSNVQSVVSATTEPTPHSGWQNTITSQGNYAYLWRKIQKFVWNATTRVYVAETAQYFRMSGTNGTSISVKGTVATVQDLPSTHADGDAYIVEADRHLYMWSDESNRWLDIGEFKGEDGKTYYTHVAWATNVTYNSTTGEVTNVTGFTIAKSPDDTTHLWMGVYVDENSAVDPSDALLYTWSYTKGVAGTSVSVDDANSKTQYAASTSSTITPSSWQDTIPTVPQGQFLWTKVTTAFTDGKSTVSYGVSYRGTDGDDVQIDTSRTYVRYSTVKTASQPADSTFTLTTPPQLSEGDYLWSLSQTAYVGVTNVLKSYSVSRLGIDGEEGQRGPDGYTTHFAYATSADGSQNFSTTNFAGATYIGTYKDDQSADSQVYTDYVWTPWKGDKGDDGTSPYFADIDNEMDAVACNHDGSVASAQTVNTKVSLWKGGEQMTSPTIKVYDDDSGEEYTSGTALNGVKVTWDANGNVKVEFGEDTPFGNPDDYVDLGLPSGVKWAARNIDVTQDDGFSPTPSGYGSYFSWGNVEGHAAGDGYDFGTSNDGTYAQTQGASLTGDIPVNDTYDAARHNLGVAWRMPTKSEYQELNSNCDSEWTSENGVAGRRFTSRINGNSIFFPASGYYLGTSGNARGSRGLYWNASLRSQTSGYYLNFISSAVYPDWYASRFIGHSVRAVTPYSGKRTFRINISKTDSGTTITREVYFTVNGMRAALDGTPATIYNIKPSVPQIVTSRDEEGFNPKTFTLRCGYTKNTGGDMTVVEDVTGMIDGTYNLYFRQHIRVGAQPTTTLYPDGIWQTTWRLYTTYKEHATNTVTLTDVLVRNVDAIEFILCTATASSVADADLGNYTVIDRETVPVVSDGAKAVPPMTETVTSQWALSDSGDTAPASGWVNERPVPTQAQRYLWQRDVHTFTADDYGRNWFTGSEDLYIVPNSQAQSSRANKKGYVTGTGGTVERDTTQELPIPELKSCVKITSTDTRNFGFAQQRATLESGRSMVLSFWAKGDVDGQTMSNRVLYNLAEAHEQSSTVAVNLTTQWQRYHMVAVVPETERPDAWSYAFLRIGQTNSTIYVCGVKLEYGSGMPTDWCKAPEDCDYTETKVVEVAGLDGTSPYFLDIDNEMHSVACASDGKPTASGSKVVNVKMWRGSTELTPTVTCAPVSQTGVTNSVSGQNVTFAWAAGTAIGQNNSWIITAVADGVTLTTTFVLNGVRAGVKGDAAVIYELIPSTSSIKKDKNNALTPASPMTCDVRKITGDTTPTRATSSDGTLRYRVDGDITSSTDGTALAINTGNVAYTSSNSYIVFAFFVGTTMVDKERVPIVSDGTDGVSPYYIQADASVVNIPCAADGKPLESKTYSVNVNFKQGGSSAFYEDYILYKASGGTGVTANFIQGSPDKVQFTVVAGTAISDVSMYEIEFTPDNINWYIATISVNAVKSGASGTPAADVTLSQYAVVFQQSDEQQGGVYPVDMTGNTTLVKAVSGSTPVKPTAISLTAVNCNATFGTNASDYNNSTIGTAAAGTYVKIQSVLTHTVDDETVPYEQGYVDISVTVGSTVFVKRFSFAVNLLGQWMVRMKGDMKQEIAQSTEYTVNGQTYNVKDNLGDFVRSSQQNISTLQTTVGDNNGGLVKQVSTLEQTSSHISLKVGALENLHNLLPNPVFMAKDNPFPTWRKVTGVTHDVTLYEGSTKSIAQGITVTSPWYFDGGQFLTFHISANTTTSATAFYPSNYNTQKRIKLMPNKTYTFSVWVDKRGSTDKINGSTIARAVTSTAATGGTTTNRTVGATSVAVIGDFTQYSVTFTTDSASVYFDWYPYAQIKAGGTGMYISYAGAKLMLEDNPSPMSYDINPKKLLDTGIDIEAGKIELRADNLIAKNNADEKTAWLDQYGNWTTRGVQANLITVIDWDNDRGRELLIPSRPTKDVAADDEYEPLPLGGTYSGTPPNIKYTVNGTTYDVAYIDIDVLRCGNMVVIKSLPVYGEGADSNMFEYNIPYCLTSNKDLWSQHRGATMFETGVPHKLTGNELRMLVGKTITFKFDLPNVGNRRYYTRIYGMKLLTPATGYSTVQNAAQDTIYYQYPTSDSQINQDFWMLNQVGHITFKHVMWVGSGVRGSGFCWVGKQLSNSSADDIEDLLDGSDWND